MILMLSSYLSMSFLLRVLRSEISANFLNTAFLARNGILSNVFIFFKTNIQRSKSVSHSVSVFSKNGSIRYTMRILSDTIFPLSLSASIMSVLNLPNGSNGSMKFMKHIV